MQLRLSKNHFKNTIIIDPAHVNTIATLALVISVGSDWHLFHYLWSIQNGIYKEEQH